MGTQIERIQQIYTDFFWINADTLLIAQLEGNRNKICFDQYYRRYPRTIGDEIAEKKTSSRSGCAAVKPSPGSTSLRM